MVPPDAYTLVHRDVIVQSTAQYRIPAIYSYRQLIKEGGLMSYGPKRLISSDARLRMSIVS
jgi:hypothetical protein